MSEEAAFLKAIIENPEDDFHRLVFADYLEDQGDLRSEFIRVQCEIKNIEAKQSPCCPACGATEGDYHQSSCHYLALRRRERQLLDEVGWPRLAGPAGPILDDIAFDWNRTNFHRGFIEELTCPVSEWVRCEATLLAAIPLRRLTLTGASRQGCPGIPGITIASGNANVHLYAHRGRLAYIDGVPVTFA